VIDARVTWLIVLTACVRYHNRQVGENYGAGDEHPTGPAGYEYGQDHARCADSHRDQVAPGTPGLLDAQPALGFSDGEDVTRVLAHDPPPRLQPYPPTQVMALGHILLGEPRVVGDG